MKSRLSTTIWTLVLLNGVFSFVVLGLAFSAGKKAGEASLFDFVSAAGGTVLFASVLALATSVTLAWRLGSGLLGPVQALAVAQRVPVQVRLLLAAPVRRPPSSLRHPRLRQRR